MHSSRLICCLCITAGNLIAASTSAVAQEPFEFEMNPSVRGVLSDDSIKQLQETLKPLHAVSLALRADSKAESKKASEAFNQAKQALDSVEAKSFLLQPDDPLALYWTNVLSDAWCVTGWAALESGDLDEAEAYLLASWRLSQDRTSGMYLARVLEAKGKKEDSARIYELASVSHLDNPMGLMGSSFPTNDELADSYKRLTGHALPDSKDQIKQLENKLSQPNSIPSLIQSTRLNGNAVFLVAFRSGEPGKATWYLNDEALAPVASALDAYPFQSFFPIGSKAKMLREVYVSCGQGKGCSAYLHPPANLDFPGSRVNWKVFYPNSPIPFKTANIRLE
jgi:hypothetical protein